MYLTILCPQDGGTQYNLMTPTMLNVLKYI